MPVLVNGQGPFDFAVDSAANTSVIVAEVAQALGLALAGPVVMNSLIAPETVETVRVASVRSGDLNAVDARLIVVPRNGLNGADGLIGRDLLAEHRLVLNFRAGAVASVSRAGRVRNGMFEARRAGARFRTTTEERLRGLLMIDARSNGADAKAILDTGAEVTIVNTAFAAAARATPIALDDGSRLGRVSSPTGMMATAAPMMLRNLSFAGTRMREVPVLVGDFHTFDLWGLADRPAALLGTDVLGLFGTVIIDLKRRELELEL